MNYYLINTTSIINHLSAQKPSTIITAFFTTKILFVGKDRQPINTQHIKYVNAAPWTKACGFEILCTAEFYALESNGVADVMAFVSNEHVIDMSAAFQEEKLQAKKIEESILYVDNLQPMDLVST